MSKTEIICKPLCGNSPRKGFINELNIAFAMGNSDFIIKQSADEIVWFTHSDKVIRGKKDFSNIIKELSTHQADTMMFESIIIHGREALHLEL